MQDITTELQALLKNTPEITGVTGYAEPISSAIPSTAYQGSIYFRANGKGYDFDYRLVLINKENVSDVFEYLAVSLRSNVLNRVREILHEQRFNPSYERGNE